VEEGRGGSHLRSQYPHEKGVVLWSQHPSCPLLPLTEHRGIQPAQGTEPDEGTARCDLEIHWKQAQPLTVRALWVRGSLPMLSTPLAFTEACRASLISLQHSHRLARASDLHSAEIMYDRLQRSGFGAAEQADKRSLNNSVN